ncbi:MAG: ATP cone domain-containing protein [Candidatus Aenigmatarchaeota archaeon]
MKVIKRDDKREDFNNNKVRKAIEEAAKRTDVDNDRTKEIVDKVAKDVEENFKDKDEVKSADIRERILERLNKEEKKVANSFRDYKK